MANETALMTIVDGTFLRIPLRQRCDGVNVWHLSETAGRTVREKVTSIQHCLALRCRAPVDYAGMVDTFFDYDGCVSVCV